MQLEGLLRIGGAPTGATMGAVWVGSSGARELTPGVAALSVDQLVGAGGSITSSALGAQLSFLADSDLQHLDVRGPLGLTAADPQLQIVDLLDLDGPLDVGGQIELRVDSGGATVPGAALTLSDTAQVLIAAPLLDQALPVPTTIAPGAQLILQDDAHLELAGAQGGLILSAGTLLLPPSPPNNP